MGKENGGERETKRLVRNIEGGDGKGEGRVG
jgi:hypothetical protein